jgi:thiamine transporter ThiT
MIGTVFGYLLGFVSGMIFNSDVAYQGGGTRNNGWEIWTAVFLIVIIAGVVWEVVGRRRQGKSKV